MPRRDPYKFQDAVLIGAIAAITASAISRSKLNSPQYVKLGPQPVARLFGKFNPSPAMLVLSRTGKCWTHGQQHLLLDDQNFAGRRHSDVRHECAAEHTAAPWPPVRQSFIKSARLQ